MSISPHGSSRSNCVCRCSSGLRSVLRPPIHIRAGENVCIHAITPMHSSSLPASASTRRIASASVSGSRSTIATGMAGLSLSAWASVRECSCTWRSVSSPYRCWLPVTNHTEPLVSSITCAFRLVSAHIRQDRRII